MKSLRRRMRALERLNRPIATVDGNERSGALRTLAIVVKVAGCSFAAKLRRNRSLVRFTGSVAEFKLLQVRRFCFVRMAFYGPFDVDESPDISKSRWSRRAGWLCAGLASATGLCCFSFVIPQLNAETSERRAEDDDEFVGRASVNSISDKASTSSTTSASRDSDDLKSDQRVNPEDDSPFETESDDRASGLLRWRRSSRISKDPFADKPAAKSISPAQANPAMRPSPLTDKSPAAIRARASRRDLLDGGDTRLARNKQSDIDQSAITAERIAAIKAQNSGPLATRRRLLEQLEQSTPATEAESPRKQRLPADRPVANRLKKPVRDLEEEVLRSKVKPVSDPDLRAMFEQPDEAEETEAPQSAQQATQRATARSSENRELPKAREEIRQIADDVEAHAEAEASDAGVAARPISTEVPVHSLMLRAKKAKEQGRLAAARQLEQAADSIQRQHQESSLRESADSVSHPESETRTLKLSDDENPTTPGSESTEPTGPSFLPAPNATFQNSESEAEIGSSQQSPPIDADEPRSATPGRAKLSTSDAAEPGARLDEESPREVPRTFYPGPHSKQKTPRVAADSKRETGAPKDSRSNHTVQISPRLKQMARRPNGAESSLLGNEPIPGQSSDAHPATRQGTVATETAAPSLIPTRTYLPDPQALANRSIQLPAPEGWSAAKKFPIRTAKRLTPQTSQTPDWNAGHIGAEADTALFQSVNANADRSKPRCIELDSIEAVTESGTGAFQVLNGNDTNQDGVRDAHFTAESSAVEPATIPEPELESRLLKDGLEPSGRPSWLTLICVAACTLLATLYWSRRKD